MQNGDTPLHWAACNGHLEVVQLLLRHRADKELKDRWGDKPVDDVCKGGNEQHVGSHLVFLKHKAAIKRLLR